MNAPTPIIPFDPPRDHIVTASDLVRHFGMWQERAIRSPVYILHRGRPRLILTSVEVMDALCAAHGPHGSNSDNGVAALLDAVGEMIVLADPDLRITHASRTARSYFGTAVAAGQAIAAIGPESARPFLAEALGRVMTSGLAETLDLPSTRFASRRLAMAIEPHPGGLALFVHDVTLASDLHDALAERRATGEAIEAVPGAARARINLRGYLERPDPSLARLSGLTLDVLGNIRFISLLEIASRVAVAQAIESVIADGNPIGTTATLLVNRAAPVPVCIGLAALRRGAVVEAVSALLVVAPSD